MFDAIEEGWLLKLNRKARMCSFCGKALSFYESKLIEAADGNRACCLTGYQYKGCDVKDFLGLSKDEKANFHYYTDG